jgi:hypothetical protein
MHSYGKGGDFSPPYFFTPLEGRFSDGVFDFPMLDFRAVVMLLSSLFWTKNFSHRVHRV